MNLKKIISAHGKLTHHPINYVGIIEASNHSTSVLFESDSPGGFTPEVLGVLLGGLIRTAWRAYNQRTDQKVNLMQFMQYLYALTIEHVKDAPIEMEDKKRRRKR